MTDFNLAEAEKLANNKTLIQSPSNFELLFEQLAAAIAHIRKLEPLVNQIWEGHRALRERIGDAMTHPLSAELRKLAGRFCLVGDEESDGLRRAADALDNSHGIGTALEARYIEGQAERERYREALEWYANPNRPWDHTIAEKALREHDK